MKNATKIYFLLFTLLFMAVHAIAQDNRTIDGYDNNLINREWGAANVNQLHIGTLSFADGISQPAGQDRPNPRFISNSLFMQNTLANDPRNLSAYCWVWGQFIDHDITLVKDDPIEKVSIPIPVGDVFFDPAGTGTSSIAINRSAYDPFTGTALDNPRQFVNSISAYIDGSAVYGSDINRANWLRTFSDGKLRTSVGNLMPWNTTTGEFNGAIDPTAPEMAMPLQHVKKWFVAGDIRANENPFLTAMHTLWMREHNRLCDLLKADYPGWSDEQLYQYARKLVGGQLQAIVYEEWLPLMGIHLPPYSYNQATNAGIMNVFSAAAYRYGHTTINSILVRMDNDGNYLPQGDILLRDAFFNPYATIEVGGIEPYLIGMATVVQQDFDCKVVDDLRNFLFGKPGEGGMDLSAINIARGRERGIADYNTVRTDFGLDPVPEFSKMSKDPLMNETLEFVYGDINNMDLWVGMLAENHMPNSLYGETALTIIEQQFLALRDGDRYYYENDGLIPAEEKQWIKATRLAEVIRRNTPITIVQDAIFEAQSLISSTKDVRKNFMDLAVYPNPAREMIFLRIPSTKSQNAVVRIIDLQGKTILERNALLSDGNNTLTLTLPPQCSPGLYIVNVLTEGNAGQQQFYKE